jgi:Zn-dependent protease
MIINLLLQNPIEGIVFLLAIALAIGIHEAAHAWAADSLGDSTAKLMGRTSINPLVHLDPIGTLLLLFAGFGWGKPVPVDEGRLRRRFDIILVALAGPASNLVLAVVLGLIYRFISAPELQHVLSLFIYINLGLMLFNLIPVPPLDGSKLLKLFISDKAYEFLEQYGFILILALFFIVRIGSLGFGDLLFRGVNTLFQLITGSQLAF